jgi:assimilatory nitrate reductase catalytic subunit
MSEVRTTCPYCGTGCGLVASRSAGGTLSLRGDPEHPANRGRLCSKGAALGDTLGLEGRLLHPVVAGRRASWDAALDRVAGGLRATVEQYGPDAVAFYVSGQLLTEDYYVANKLIKGFIGSANIDSNSRLCMASAVAGHKRAFGSDAVPGSYDDLEQADLVVIVGSNLAWCHPVLFQRLRDARRTRGTRVVVVDPRRTPTCEEADLHLPLRPGSDVTLFGGLLVALDARGAIDAEYVGARTEGFATALAAARAAAATASDVAHACGLAAADVEQFYAWFAATPRTLTLFSQGINQSSRGTDQVNAILNCHLATGRVGRPGASPFSLTGQPNAMGGREVGALANQLAAHMDFSPADRARVAAFWGAPRLAAGPGLKAVELFEAVARRQVRAIWIMATNPLVSLPDAERVRRALARCDLVVLSDCVADTDTAAVADVLLPAQAWGEKEGTVSNSERCISRQRRFVEPPGETRPDWWMVCEVARRLGHGAAFAYDGPAAIFREHARLTALDNGGRRLLDLGALADLDGPAYAALEPLRWPWPAGAAAAGRLFADGPFPAADGRARFVAVAPLAPAAAGAPGQLVLNTGRIRDQWHTMTRTGRSARLAAHCGEPYVQLHPDDAARAHVADGTLARVGNRRGELLARVVVDRGQRPGSLFVPMHWSDRFAARGRVNALVAPRTDPHSGQPAFKHDTASLAPFGCAWHGLLLCRRDLALDGADYWVRSRAGGAWRYDLAGAELPTAWPEWSRARLCVDQAPVEWIEYEDRGRRGYRAARLVDGQLESCLFVEPGPIDHDSGWLIALFAAGRLTDSQRAALLGGRPPSGAAPSGKVVCSCFGVGEAQIVRAIAEHGLVDVAALGTALQAGTGCGSCLPELHRLLRETARVAA